MQAKRLGGNSLFKESNNKFAKVAGRKGGLATWKKWKISRRGAELKIDENHHRTATKARS